MSVALAEQPYVRETREEYAASLTTLRRLGEASLSGVGVECATELAYDDFTTKVAEMLKTDSEFGSQLDVARVKSFPVEHGNVCSAVGEPIVTLVKRGYDASRNAQDVRLRETQAIRDEGDVLVALEADRLAVGQAMIVVSMDPKRELAGRDAAFWRQRGYRDGIAYIQWYARVSETELCAAAYSVDHSDVGVMSDLLKKRNVTIPDDVEPNTFIQNMWRFDGDAETADAAARQLRQESYEQTGTTVERVSIDEYLHAQDALCRKLFDTYYPAIGQALVTGKNQKSLQDFAIQVLTELSPGKLAPEVLRHVMAIAHVSIFTPDMARAMDELIPYALTEQLRRGLAIHRSPGRTPVVPVRAAIVLPPTEYMIRPEYTIHQVALGGLQSGLAAGRSYGGCSGTNLVAQSTEGDLQGPQTVYGGAEGGKIYAPGEDQYGPLTFTCTEGHTNTRSRGKLLTECCVKGCKKGSVGCK